MADEVVEAFGADRMMWASNWPVADEAGGYAAWHAAATELVAGCSPQDRDLIFGGTAAAFYGIGACG